MESFATEILEVVCESYKDDEELLVSILSYLYQTLSDDIKMAENIERIMEDMGYCPDCGNKLETYTFEEVHDELDYNNVEVMSVNLCPLCDRKEISNIK